MNYHSNEVASAMENGKEGPVPVPEQRFVSRDGFEVIQRKTGKSDFPVFGKLFTVMNISDILEEVFPDLIFYHGMISTSIHQAVQYKKKHPSTVIVMDNHMDWRIGFVPDTLRAKCKAAAYRASLRPVFPWISRIYGVTPWRKSYAEQVFGAPKKKTDILIMGADDDAIPFSERDRIREIIRTEHKIGKDEVLIVSGGRLSENKNILPNIVNYIKTIGSLLDYAEITIPQHYNVHQGKAHRTRWIQLFEEEFLRDYTICGHRVFSYALIYGPDNDGQTNFSFTVDMK